MNQSTTGERVTAAISTIVAIAILSAAVTAQQAGAPPTDQLATLESDLRFQLELAFHENGAAHKSANADLERTLAGWRASPQSPRDHASLVAWFDAALTQTMPGRSGKLPPAPDFGGASKDIDPATAPAADNPVQPAATPGDGAVPEPATPAAAETATEAPDDDAESVSKSPADHSIAVRRGRITFSAPFPTGQTQQPLPGETLPPSDAALAAADDVAAETAGLDAPSADDAAAAYPGAEPASADTTLAADRANDEVSPQLVADDPPAPAAPAPPVVHINLRELNARVYGYHQDLGDIEAAVVADDERSPERLAALVERLERLALQYQFIRLYYDSLPPTGRRAVAEPRTMGEALALVNRHVARSGEGGDFLEDFDAASAHAPTLTDRLQIVAESVGVSGD